MDETNRRCLLSLDETAVFSLERGLCPISGFQLSEDVRHVILYCAFGEEECAGDLSIAGALRNQAQYLQFAFGERLDQGLKGLDMLTRRGSNGMETRRET